MTDATMPASADAQQAAIQAALLVLEKMGLTPADLAAGPGSGRSFRPSPSTCRWCRPR